ncbi:MAG: Eco57I restriction-modification methylase domain-containing protein [Bacteroidetes bacterium]|nr:Eco57I restriction-modification methylase domain-containing protein [Bacteroidota bacterium]
MKITLLAPKQALNKAYLKEKVIRSQFDVFKSNLTTLLDETRLDESEEFSKKPLIKFLENTFYKEKNEINTKDKIDLVIYNDKTSSGTAGVLLEVKKASNKSEMITSNDINKKAFHELILYYLRERVDGKNIDIKHLVATNIYEWFIFDATDFERLFYKNSGLIKKYEEWKTKQKVSGNTDLFYNDIAKPFLDELKDEIKVTHFDLRNFNLTSSESGDEKKLISLYKIFSPVHLLKQPFANDSNRLDRAFYNELLHIIGLEETKEKNKKVITRKAEGKRDPGSFIENTMLMLRTEDRLPKVTNIASYGKDKEERLFNVALELNITWINRILFLKLLEAQLHKYHNGNDDYKFLNSKAIKDYDVLNKLFFQVLAVKPEERLTKVKKEFGLVPYLNSSLFEINRLEDEAIRVNTLEDDVDIPIYSATVLKDQNGKRLKGSMPALHYMFEFLEAYDFTSEGKEEIQEENKTLINASVLGLIFEKINGYKDGSFFTPGFITMYMCRETIRRAVVQKFNDKFNWKCKEFADLYNHLTGRTVNEIKEYNSVVNSLTLCDPAVGSGHFLVSALNEIIAVKSELGILADEEGRLLRDYDVKVENDELIVTSGHETELFEYHINNGKPHEEIQRVQKTLFLEKQTIIENCLFGVDINQNSVKIARLRLWIELLKNAYYTQESKFTELETLPNIDINIKQGNSLISRFPIDTDLKQVLKTIKWKVEDYRILVYEYKNEHNKEKKHAVKKLIDDIKSNFRTEISARDPRQKKLSDLTYELHNKYQTDRLIDIEMTDKEKDKLKKEEEKLLKKIEKLSDEIKEIEEGEIYRDAFEWRFEFPEVLADNGDYIGFDVVIGNPPYLPKESISESEKKYYYGGYSSAEYQLNTYGLFVELTSDILTNFGKYNLIIPNYWLSTDYDRKLRKLIAQDNRCIRLINLYNVFEEATVDTLILTGVKEKPEQEYFIELFSISEKLTSISERLEQFFHKQWVTVNNQKVNTADNDVELSFQKTFDLKQNKSLKDYFEFYKGMQPYEEGKGHPKQTRTMMKDKVYHSKIKIDNTYQKLYTAKSIKKYKVTWFGEWIKYGNNLAAQRDPKIFKGSRILANRILSKERIDVAVAEEEFINNSDIFNLIPKSTNKVSTKVFCSILCSRLCSTYFKRKNINLNRKTYPKINVNTLEKFPMPGLSDHYCSKLIGQYDKLSNVDENDHSVIKELEKQLDILVYKLYELTWGEVMVVDPEFTLSKEEYENYELSDE